MNSGIKALKSVGKTLGTYRTSLLNYFKHRITCGAVEGRINKIMTLKRQTYGFEIRNIPNPTLPPAQVEVFVGRMNRKSDQKREKALSAESF
jgi:hypothetical protein